MEQKKSIKDKVAKVHTTIVNKTINYIKSLFYKVTDLRINEDDEYMVNLNVVDQGSEINGDCIFNHNCRVSGRINGNVVCINKIVLDKHSTINGNVYASQILVDGVVTKNLYCEGKITLTKNAKVFGDIYTVKIEVSPEANFKGVISKENINDIEKHWNSKR